MKKALALFLITSIILSGCSLFRRKAKDSNEPDPSASRISEPVNLIDVSQRPYLSITPSANGRELTLSVGSLAKDASEAEYELEYQSGDLLQGAFGSFDFSSATLPASKEILLGSCSAGGACTYHENVTGGTLTMKFEGDETYAVKTEWRFIKSADADGQYSSRDGRFQIEAGTLLDRNSYIVVMNTSGLPSPSDRSLLAGPYGIFPSGNLPNSGEIELTVRLSEAGESATIIGWDGEDWVEFDTTIEDSSATATVDLLSTYIVVQ